MNAPELIERTKIHTKRARLRWAQWEVTVLKVADRSDADMAQFLGRSIQAVRSKRQRINKGGVSC